eukprot:TRINITY_DN5819_c0_g1_i2.p1 TRINITY_DN5819_c0_g1~~TRINITY_DN5819_c0_g1_i2.p1  ORF type:complete len:341 (-),score=95.34 TRINITY_DN5819_c0_g1_i2:209-1186(-)
MKYRPLGNTGLSVSVLSFGCGPLGGVYGQVDADEAKKAVKRAIELGVNLFDSSPFYGAFKSEERLGEALKGIPREKFIVATKIGRYAMEYGKQESRFDFSSAGVTQSVLDSLSRLQLDYIDIIQCHDIEFGDLKQVVEEALPALEALRQQGKVKFIGITGLPLSVLSYVLDHAKTKIDTILSYTHYTLCNTSLADNHYIDKWSQKGVGVINAAALSMGLLAPGGPPEWHPASTELKTYSQKARDHCKAKGANIAKLATQFSLANEKIATTLVGFKNSKELEEVIEWIDQPMDEGLLKEVQEIFTPVKNQTWPMGTTENAKLCEGY